MIIKNFEINKINLNKNKFILFYGKNEGLKNFEIKKLFIDTKKIFTYDEKDIQKMMKTLSEKIQELRVAFRKGVKSDNEFKF